MIEVAFIILLNVAVTIGSGFDALGTAYKTSCEAAGYEYHSFDEHYPNTYHCTGLPRRDR